MDQLKDAAKALKIATGLRKIGNNKNKNKKVGRPLEGMELINLVFFTLKEVILGYPWY